MHKCHLFFCTSMQQHVPYGTQGNNTPSLEMSVFARAHAQLSNCNAATNARTYHMEGITRTLVYINRAEWMKGICHIWSRGRHFSPSLPAGDDRYLKLSPQKRSPSRNLGEHRLVRRSGTASRGTAPLVFNMRMNGIDINLINDLITSISWCQNLQHVN